MSTQQPRVPRGVSSGGRFAPSPHTEPSVSLDGQGSDPRPRRVAGDGLDPAKAFEIREQARAVGATHTVSARAGHPVYVAVREP